MIKSWTIGRGVGLLVLLPLSSLVNVWFSLEDPSELCMSIMGSVVLTTQMAKVLINLWLGAKNCV